MNLPSKILEQAVEQLATLPGVGKRSALRYALHLMKEDELAVRDLSEAILRLKTDLHRCRYCHNVSDTEVCPICSSEKRQRGIVCVVENVQDVMALENTQQYRGLYHVLGLDKRHVIKIMCPLTMLCSAAFSRSPVNPLAEL